jgi:hypothetical protein
LALITVEQIVQYAAKQWGAKAEIQRIHVTISAEVDAYCPGGSFQSGETA